MLERIAVLFMWMHLPVLIALVWRWLQWPGSTVFEAGWVAWILFVSTIFIVCVWLGLLIAAVCLGGSRKSNVPQLHADGMYDMSSAWAARLRGVNALEITLSFRAEACGLLDLPKDERAARFAVPHNQDDHDDRIIAEWFAKRLGLTLGEVHIQQVSSGTVSARFRRQVTWSVAKNDI